MGTVNLNTVGGRNSIFPTGGWTNRNVGSFDINTNWRRAAATALSFAVDFELLAAPAAPAVIVQSGDSADSWILYIDSSRILHFYNGSVGDIITMSAMATSTRKTITVSWAADNSAAAYVDSTADGTGSLSGAKPSTAKAIYTGQNSIAGDKLAITAAIIHSLKIWQGSSGTPAALAAITPTLLWPMTP